MANATPAYLGIKNLGTYNSPASGTTDAQFDANNALFLKVFSGEVVKQ